MSKLFERAKVKYENALNNYEKIDINDAYLDDCCYNLQQTIEYCLKFIVEMNGEAYIENHDVRAELNILSTLSIKLPVLEDIRKMASTLNSWNVESRYNDNFLALIEDVQDAKKIAKKLIDYCESINSIEIK